MMLSPKMPDLSALEVFVHVAEHGSINAAAGVLGVSQQAVSARIASMERQSGVTLLLRTPRGSSLTPAGVVVSEWSSRLLALAEEMSAGLSALSSDAATTLTVAASLTVAEYLLPGWLVALQDEHRRAGRAPLSTELTVVNSSAVVDQVRAGRAALGFVEGARPPRGLRHRVVARDRLVVVAAPAHPWSRRTRALSVPALARAQLVARESGSGTREVLSVEVARSLGPGVELGEPVLSLPTTAAVRAAVLAGAGPAVLSELAVADDVAAGRLRAIPVEGSLDLTRRLRAVWGGTPQPPRGAARDLVRIAVASSRRR